MEHRILFRGYSQQTLDHTGSALSVICTAIFHYITELYNTFYMFYVLLFATAV